MNDDSITTKFDVFWRDNETKMLTVKIALY